MNDSSRFSSEYTSSTANLDTSNNQINLARTRTQGWVFYTYTQIYQVGVGICTQFTPSTLKDNHFLKTENVECSMGCFAKEHFFSNND